MKIYAKTDFSGPNKSCMVNISGPSISIESNNKRLHIIKIEQGEQSHYASVHSIQSRTNSDTPLLKINGKFGRLLNLTDGELVLITTIQHEVPAIQKVFVQCDSEDDFEILESNAEVLCNNFLSQIRVVYPGLHFPFWVSQSLSINLTIEKLEPSVELGIVESFTEVIIPSIMEPDNRKTFILKSCPKLRLHPLLLIPEMESLSPTSKLLLENIEHAFAYKSVLVDLKFCDEYKKNNDDDDDDESNDSVSSFYAKIIPVQDKHTEKSKVSEISFPIIKIFFIENIISSDNTLKTIFPYLNPPNLFIHPKFLESCSTIDLKFKSFIAIEQITNCKTTTTPTTMLRYEALDMVSTKQLSTNYYQTFSDLLNEARNFLSASLGLTMAFRHGMSGSNFGIMLVTGKSGSGKTTFAQNLAKSFTGFPHFLHYESISCAKLKGKKTETIQKELESVLKHCVESHPSILFLDDLDVLCPADKSEQQNLQEEFLNYRTCEIISEVFMSLEGKQIAIICTAKGKNSLHSYWKSREGCHIFQFLIQIPSPNKYERLGIFQTCLFRYQNRPQTTKTTTSPSTFSSTNSNIKTTGTPDEGNVFAIQPQTENVCFSFKDNNDFQITETMENALFNLHDDYSSPNTIHNIAKKWMLFQAKDTFSNLSNEKKDETFLEIVQLEISSREPKNRKTEMLHNKMITWDEIGGASYVKSELTKILQWPIKYSKLFDSSPIKMPCGILLYGYPGTGKTLVGLSMSSVVPNAKFIHIKGPELLSKYIGASEQAVQDLFLRAKESSPCVIFFDEFDSLVPRRGHDNTGVTDRVVNQFLAEMDGIEGGLGKGVYLIAATSRPDLIDPAVLRPGRLDKLLFFDLPNEEERLEIIRVLSTHVKYSDLDGEILWDEIAHYKTKGFSGADLHSLLCTAQLEAIQHSIGELMGQCSTDEGPMSKDVEGLTQELEEIFVTKKHIEKAFQSFKTSLPIEEYNKFKNIYANFSSGKRAVDNSDPGSFLIERGKKATLA